MLALLGRSGDRDQAPALAQRAEVVRAEEVEDGIGAPALRERADLFGDVVVVVDGFGTEFADEVVAAG